MAPGAPKPKRKPTSTVPRGIDAAAKQRAQQKQDASDHHDQRTIVHQAMRDLGIKTMNNPQQMAELRAYIAQKYGVQANGQTLDTYRKQFEEKQRQMRQDAQNIRQQKIDAARQANKPASGAKTAAERSADSLNKLRQGKGGTGRSRGKSSNASAGSEGLSRSEIVKKAWITRRKNAGLS